MESIIDDIQLAKVGEEKMPWFRKKMPIITQLNSEFQAEKPFEGMVIAACFHIEPKTAYWLEGIVSGGAKHIYLVGNLGTTQPETAAFLATHPIITVLGKKDDTYEEHKKYLALVMSVKIDLFLDNGASLILAHNEHQPGWMPIGANEETRSGRLLIEQAGVVPGYPVVVIDDSPVKRLMENAIGVGQSVVDGFMRATSLMVGGKKTLVIGYGFCGTGIATKFRGLGAIVMVCEKDPIMALKAKGDGYDVGTLEEMLPRADIVITVTGCFNVLTEKHIPFFKQGSILANAGHYGFEIDCEGLRNKADNVAPMHKAIEEITFGQKQIYLLENAVPLNLSAADGNPIEIMDIGLGLQSGCARRIATSAQTLPKGLQTVPSDIENSICKLSLDVLQ